MLKTSTAMPRVRGSALSRRHSAEPVELGDEDLRDDDVGDDLPGLRQSGVSVLLELDGVTGLVQEVRLELADVRIAFDDQDDRLCLCRPTSSRRQPRRGPSLGLPSVPCASLVWVGKQVEAKSTPRYRAPDAHRQQITIRRSDAGVYA